MWIIYTLGAVASQTVRNACSRSLSRHHRNEAVSFARFFFGLPLALLVLLILVLQDNPLRLNPSYLFWSGAMAACQLGANLCLVALFHEKNFAMALSLTKTEGIWMTALAIPLLAELPSLMDWLGLAVASAGIVWSVFPRKKNADPTSHQPKATPQYRALLLAVAAGLGLALSAIFLRFALNQIPDLTGKTGGFFAVVQSLVLILGIQSLLIGTWLMIKDPKALAALFKQPLIPALSGLMSALGSFCWFMAFASTLLVNVRTLGQVEYIAGTLVSLYIFKEKIQKHDWLAMGLTALGTILVIIA